VGKLAEAYVDIRGDDSDLDATLNRSQASLGSFVAGAKSSLAGLAAAAGIGSIGAIGVALFHAADRAADLHESLDKVGNAFGPAGGGIVKLADELADRFGVVKQESLDAASAFGLMGRAAGLTREQSAGLGAEFTRFGIDLASFHNLTNQEAFEKLRSGLAGESEPLRPLGILLSEDAVKAEALAMGLTKVKRELTDQEKVLARASLIRKQMETQGSAGDLERTAGSTKNQLKKLQGDIENFKTALGESLISPLGEAIKLVRELGEDFAKAFGTTPLEGFGAELKAILQAIRAAREDGTLGRANAAVKAARDPLGFLLDNRQAIAKKGMEALGLAKPPPAGKPGESTQDRADRLAGVAKGIPGSPAEVRAAQEKAFLAQRQARDRQLFEMARKDFDERRGIQKKEASEALNALGRGALRSLFGGFAAIPGALSQDRLTSLAAQARLQEAAGSNRLIRPDRVATPSLLEFSRMSDREKERMRARLERQAREDNFRMATGYRGDKLGAAAGGVGPLSGAAGLLLRGGLEAARKLGENAYNPDRRMSQSFGGSALDINRAMQAEILDQSDVQRKQLEKLEEAGKKLGEIKEGIGEVAKNLKDKFVARFNGK
jgi:hypothetical protein